MSDAKDPNLEPWLWFDARDYGAAGDWPTDDLAAIQAAIAAAEAAGGGVVLLPSTLK